MRKVASYNSLDEAYIVASFLEGSGLSPNVRDAYTASVYTPQIIGGVSLEVPDYEYEKARVLLELPSEKAEISKTCPYCGSSNLKINGLGLFPVLMCLLTFAPRKHRSSQGYLLGLQAGFQTLKAWRRARLAPSGLAA
ncbi:hypothetical protein [Pelagicoccus albus]|uniref:Signal transducing protein n=1 Tax=Pelagicoccus albus TaxID=415222 RepID=A0A7X1B4A6_9BACT|nr:hypothetical protein [Pelagicoccus albus]MBC2605154.1 hypothetical protein [Pelagicoccus albus]